MKKLNWLLLLCLPLFLGMTSSEKELFQVVTAHPEILERLLPHIETVKKENRLWLVKVTGSSYWKNVPEVLRPYKASDAMTYSYPDQPETREAADPIIAAELTTLSQKNIQDDIVWLASYKNRSAGSLETRDALQKISARLTRLGFQVSEVCYQKDICSVVADLQGSVKPDEVLLVMGHLDSVGKDFAGADDNASGTAVSLEMARVLSKNPHDRTVRIFITNGEEVGLLGATHYAEKLYREGTLNKIVKAINMDMVSYNHNGIVELETDREYEALAQKFAGLASQYTTLKTKITLGAWGSDHVPFLRRGVPTILTIEDWETKTPCYHQACDKPETLNYGYTLEIAKLNLAAILSFDQAP